MVFSTEDAARLVRQATRRRANGSRGLWARRAWRRLVLRCAAGDPAAQEAVRAIAAELPETDVRELLAAAPQEPADAAAYLVLVRQSAQYRALDPDGSLLALAYRAAAAEVRERLRTVMAAEGDAEVIRVVVTGDQRDRIAEMSTDELAYLRHQLAEHQSWDELRRLTLDLPLAEAAEAARLLPERERTGGAALSLSTLAARPPGQLRALVGRLPQVRLITHNTPGHRLLASFSPDASELAVTSVVRQGAQEWLHVETLRTHTGEVTRQVSHGPTLDLNPNRDSWLNSLLHLGDEILMRKHVSGSGKASIVRVLPDREGLGHDPNISDMRRSSGGAVMIYSEGLAFVDRGADRVRYQQIPRFSGRDNAGRGAGSLVCRPNTCSLTTLPDSRLIAFSSHLVGTYVVDEDGNVLHDIPTRGTSEASWYCPGLSFLSESSLAVHHYVPDYSSKTGKPGQYTEIWEFPPGGTARRTDEHRGPIRERWPLEEWRGLSPDAYLGVRMLSPRAPYGEGPIDTDIPWLRDLFRPGSRQRSATVPQLLTLSPGGDTLVIGVQADDRDLEVHSPHLPSARTLLEQPLLRSTRQDLRRAADLRSRIDDPAVRDALDLLGTCLADRFGQDIALGTGSGTAGSATDIALGEPGTAG